MSVTTKRTLGDYKIQTQANVELGTRANTIIETHTLIVNGNLQITGDQLSEIEANLVVKDSVIYIKGGAADTGNTNIQDKGITFDWYTPSSVKKRGFFGFQDATNNFIFIPDATFNGTTYTGEFGSISANLTGYLSLANGSNTAPSLSFTSSPSTGMYYAGSNSFGLVAGSVETARISQNLLNVFGNANVSQYLMANTVLSDVGYGLSSATNTGFFFTSNLISTIQGLGNNIAEFVGDASAVNYLSVNNSATSQPLSLIATGSDSNIDFIISAKGTGNVIIDNLRVGNINVTNLTTELNSNAIVFTSNANVLTTTNNLLFDNSTLTLTGDLSVDGNIAANAITSYGYEVLSTNYNFANAVITDVTITGNSSNLTANLKAINANTGVFGNTTHYSSFSVNDKGLIVSASAVPANINLVGNSGVTSLSINSNVNILGLQGISTTVSDSNIFVLNTGVLGIVTASNLSANASTGIVNISSNASLQDVTTVGSTTNSNVSFTSSSNTAVTVTGGIVGNSLKVESGNIWSGIGTIKVNSANIADVADPVSLTDAVNKQYLANYVATSTNAISYLDSSVTVNDTGPTGGNIIVNLDGNLRAYWTANTLQFTNYTALDTGNIRINNSTISATGINSIINSDVDLILASKGTGNIILNGNVKLNSDVYTFGQFANLTTPQANIGNIRINGGSITSNIGNITIAAATGSVVSISGVGALRVPTGTTAQRPFSAEEVGQIRFNTDLGFLEYFNGNTWVNSFNEISTETISPDGIANTFTLSSSVSTEGALVSINGTVQQPGYAYTVAGNVITFTSTPAITDVIEVRKLTITYNPVITGDLISDNANVTINLVPTIVDSFSANSFRSAKYFVSVSNTTFGNYQSSEIILVHNGAASVSSVGSVYTDTALASFTSNISSGSVNLLATGTVAGSTIKLQKTYIAV